MEGEENKPKNSIKNLVGKGRNKVIFTEVFLTVSSWILKNFRNLLAAKTSFLAVDGHPKRATFLKSLPDNHLKIPRLRIQDEKQLGDVFIKKHNCHNQKDEIQKIISFEIRLLDFVTY